MHKGRRYLSTSRPFLTTLQPAKCFIISFAFVMNSCLSNFVQESIVEGHSVILAFMCSLDGSCVLIQ